MHWLDKQIIVSRMTAVSGSKLAYVTVTAVMAQLQPLSLEKTQSMGGVFGKAFRIWVDPDIAIQEGDLLKDPDGVTYKVKKGGVTARAFGSIDYKEITIEQT